MENGTGTSKHESSHRGKKENNFLGISILIAAVLVSGSVVYAVSSLSGNSGITKLTGGSGNNIPQLPTPSIEGEPVLGDDDAPVTIIEFSDFQCPFCGQFFSQTLPLIRENYIDTGKAKLVYKDLAFLGPESVATAEAANCAGDQGKFWEFHDTIFAVEITDGKEHNGNLNRDLFLQIAGLLELNEEDFISCVDSNKYQSEVAEDVQEANQYLTRVSTPSFLINGRPVTGALPYPQFVSVLDAALEELK